MKLPVRLALLAALLPTLGASGERDDLVVARVAALLAEADAAAAGSAASLAPLLEALDRLGAHPATAGDDAVGAWRGRVRAAPAPPWRGRVLGPAYRRGALPPAGEFRTEQLFLAGTQASVALATVPAAPVRMSVATGQGAACPAVARECAWWPMFTQRYTITIRNMGPTPVRYYLVLQ